MTHRRGEAQVAVLAYQEMSAFELGIVTEIFGVPWPAAPRYELIICAERAEPVTVVGGAVLHTRHGLAELADADTVIIPSVADVHAEASADLVTALRRAHHRGARIVSICTGAFALASAGLLDGRRATTHWLHTDLMRQRYPRVRVDPRPLYVEDEGLFTSAGSAAGIDLCLQLVRRDHGAAAANTLARRLVVAPHRDGGQAQYIEAPLATDPHDDRIAASMAWALAHLGEPVSVATLARQACMAPRTYLRKFAQATGVSPIKWLISQRVHASLPLLEVTDRTVAQVASAVGFETAITYRHHFQRAMQTSPSAYRRAFRSA